MKRIVLAVAGTISVVVLLFGYDTSTSGPMATTSQTSVISGGSGSSGSSASGSSGSSGSSSTRSSGGSGSGSGSSSATAATSTVTGDVAQTQWGPVQVQLTVEGSKVTQVDVVQYPNGNGRDQEINSYALPILIQETVDAQSAQIDMVSGATVTSTGYLQSLQSALDQVQA